MTADREIIVKPLGLITQPNEKGVYPAGALRVASDWIMRSPGVLENQFRTGLYASVATGTIHGLYATRSQALQLVLNGSTWGLHWTTLSGVTAATLPSVTDRVFSSTGRSNTISFRDRLIINPENADPLTADYDNPSSTAERTFRWAGLPQPKVWPQAGTSDNPGVALRQHTTATYGAHIEREFSDGYIMVGPMSELVRVRDVNGYANTQKVLLQIYLPDGVVAGDRVRVFRSQAISNPDLDVNIDSGTTLYEVKNHTVTAADIIGDQFSFYDSAAWSEVGGPLGGLGEEAYTNPGQQGLDASKTPPPVAAALAVFNGRALYANCRFQAEYLISIRAGYGSINSIYGAEDEARGVGIGLRRVVGDLTNGSAVVTGISADDLVGVVPGQFITDGTGLATHIPLSTFIVSVGVSSITMNKNATASAADMSLFTGDMIEIDGDAESIQSGQVLVQGFVNHRFVSERTLAVAGFDRSLKIRVTPQRYLPPATMTLRATNGQNYDPPLPEIDETVLTIQPTHRKNCLMWSEDQQPEAVPERNQLFVGSGEIYALAPTRDAVWCFASDGLWRISGTFARVDGFPDVRVDMFDPTCFLVAPRAWCILRDNVYAWTNRGFVQISDNGVKELSEGVIGDTLVGRPWSESSARFLVADEAFDEIFVVDTVSNIVRRYALRYNCWLTTTQYGSPLVGCYFPPSRAAMLATSTALNRVSWNQTERQATVLPTLRFQPIYGNRPDGLKQFIDATAMFSADSDALVSGYFGVDQVAGAVSAALDVYGDDKRATYGIPRNAPAIAPSLTAWLQMTNPAIDKTLKLSGLSVRYVPITEQQGVR